MRSAWIGALLLLPLGGCGTWFFSGNQWVDRSQPVALVETTGGIECGATTEFGVLTLGRSATSGPCRVRYLLGPTPMVETGELQAAGGVFYRADIDLKTQQLRALDRAPHAEDRLRVMWTMDGWHTESVAVRLASTTTDGGIRGDVLADPGVALPAGACVLCEKDDDDGWLFAGLIAGAAVDETSGERFYVFAGVDRLREMLAIPTPHPQDFEPKYRPDDVPVRKPVKPDPTPVGAGPAGAGGLPAGFGAGLQQMLEALQKAQAQRAANPGASPAPAAPAPATPPAGQPGGQAGGQPTTPPQQPR
jgi:hypothetical protein